MIIECIKNPLFSKFCGKPAGSTLLAGNIISKTGNSINLYVKETSSVAIIPITEDTTILPIYDGMKDERESELISFHTTYITTVKTSTPNAEYLFDVVYSLSSLSWRANYSLKFNFSNYFLVSNLFYFIFKLGIEELSSVKQKMRSIFLENTQLPIHQIMFLRMPK